VYGKDYDKGGFPTLTNIFSSRQLINITFSWIILTIVIALSFNFFGIMNYGITGVLLVLLCGWLLYHAFMFLRSDGDNKVFKNMFIRINIFALLIITFLSLDKLIQLFLE
jgi:heme O synthase-like polyprenyltransferase